MKENIDVQKLAHLARIDVSKEKEADLKSSISDILEYVESVQEVAADEKETPEVGAVYNQLRADKNPHEPGEFSNDLLGEAPQTEGGHFVVPPILN